jgi:hypothetical protein
MSLPSGYRFFRDDLLLEKRAKEASYCDRCGEFYWITDDDKRHHSKRGKSYLGDGYCLSCRSLMYKRIDQLKKDRPRAGCPIDSEEYIYTEKYHNYSGRQKWKARYETWQSTKEFYEEHEKQSEQKQKEDFEKLLKKPKKLTLYEKLMKIKKERRLNYES